MVRVAPAAAPGLVPGLCCDVVAGPPTDTLNGVFMAVNHLLDDPELRERPARLLTAIRSVVGDRFDVREASRLAFGREWHARTSTERDELVRLFGDLLEHAYVSRIASRANVHRGLAIRYLGESIDGDRAAVTTTIGCRDGSEIPSRHPISTVSVGRSTTFRSTASASLRITELSSTGSSSSRHSRNSSLG